jgi:DNA-binding transcriptional ArsR family regulator
MQGTMRSVQGPSQLLPLLRTPLLGELLAWMFLHPDDDCSVTDLAKRFKTSQSTISREADRLVAAGLIKEARRGNLRLIRANADSPLARPLTDLLTLTYGPAAVLGDLLAPIDGVDEAYIYGSWAARYTGEPGPPPRDVDVLVVGGADDDELFDAARNAERTLGREVNVHRVSPKSWRAPGNDPFLASVRSRPLYSINLDGTGHEVAARPRRDRRHDQPRRTRARTS